MDGFIELVTGKGAAFTDAATGFTGGRIDFVTGGRIGFVAGGRIGFVAGGAGFASAGICFAGAREDQCADQELKTSQSTLDVLRSDDSIGLDDSIRLPIWRAFLARAVHWITLLVNPKPQQMWEEICRTAISLLATLRMAIQVCILPIETLSSMVTVLAYLFAGLWIDGVLDVLPQGVTLRQFGEDVVFAYAMSNKLTQGN